MPAIHEIRKLPFSAEQMFDLVADVARYGEFLPWVVATRVKSNTDSEMVADMLVGFKALREKFTSKVVKQRPYALSVQYIDGPLRDLDNQWQFRSLGPHSCEVEFTVSFSFKSAMLNSLAGQYFDKAFRKMVEAFEMRAGEIYGSSNSSATNVA
ncbi:MAG: hypothetical protein RLY97_362 [Pseudomonadota bacterium]|jgi:coenzyme Q-binding protein COQ10